MLLQTLDCKVLTPALDLSLSEFGLLLLNVRFPYLALGLCILLKKLMVFLQASQTPSCFGAVQVSICSFLLELISFLVHLNQELFHSFKVSCLAIQFDLQGLTSLIDTFILRSLQGINLTQLCLLCLHLHLSQTINLIIKVLNFLLFILHGLLRVLSLAFKHLNLGCVAFSFLDCCDCSCLFFIKHATKFFCFSLSPLTLKIEELL